MSKLRSQLLRRVVVTSRSSEAEAARQPVVRTLKTAEDTDTQPQQVQAGSSMRSPLPAEFSFPHLRLYFQAHHSGSGPDHTSSSFCFPHHLLHLRIETRPLSGDTGHQRSAGYTTNLSFFLLLLYLLHVDSIR